jgi:hypothetical protein
MATSRNIASRWARSLKRIYSVQFALSNDEINEQRQKGEKGGRKYKLRRK